MFVRLRKLLGIRPRLTAKRFHYITPGLFPEIDLTAVKASLEIEERARERGAQDSPASGLHGLDPVELEIADFFVRERKHQYERAMSNVQAYDTRLNALLLDHRIALIEAVPHEASTQLSTVELREREALHRELRDYQQARRDLEAFKNANRLTRAAIYPLSGRLRWALLALMLLIETFVNGALLAEGSAAGLLGGAIIAFALSVINVGAGVIEGRTLFRWFFHRSSFRKTIAAVVFLAWIGAIVGFNLTVAHYREAMETMARDPSAETVRTLTTTPLTFARIDSWLLLILGASFSCFALCDGFSMDDRYPGYGAVDRRFREHAENYRAEKDIAYSTVEELKDGSIARLDQLASELDMQSNEQAEILEKRQQIIATYRGHEAYLCSSCNNLLSAYRAENTAHREMPPPPHFAETWSFTSLALPAERNEDERAFRELKERTRAVLASVNRLKTSILEGHDAVIAGFRQIEEEERESAHA